VAVTFSRSPRQQLRPFGGRQAEVVGDRAAEGGERPLATIGDATQQREEDFVELGMGMGISRSPDDTCPWLAQGADMGP
jgi:hypothetical protein